MKKKVLIAVMIIVLFVCMGYELIASKYLLSISYYTLTSSNFNNMEESIRIVQLTDLHNSEFGTENKRLIDKVSDQSPDLILITGDLLNSHKKNTEIACNLLSSLSDIAPVYLSLGNHEIEYEENYQTDIISLYEECGAHVLDFTYEDIEVKGQRIRMGGLYGYCIPAKYLETNEADPEECAFLSDFQDTDSYTILLTHMPVCWLQSDGLNEWNVDCVFSGHVHGGEVIFPFIGGLYAPDFGWFPGKLQGLYHSDDGEKTLVLSRGLGTTEVVPRFNNIPEIVVVDLVPNADN